MIEYLNPIDCEGTKLEINDNIVIVKIPNHLLENLPKIDKKAITAQIGKQFNIKEFDRFGFVEIEFEYQLENTEITYHTIWIEPDCLKKIAA